MVLNIVVHWIHLMAAVVWVGGSLFMALVLGKALRRSLPPETRRFIHHEIGTRFKWVQGGCLLVLLGTGAFKWWPEDFSELFHSSYGRAFGIKLALVAWVAALSLLHAYVWSPRLAALAERPESPEFHRARFRLLLWGEVALLLNVGVILLSATLRYGGF